MDKYWGDLIKTESSTNYFQNIIALINDQKSSGITVYPDEDNIFLALQLAPYENVKVIILGQDPYHSEGLAHGLAFSVPESQSAPPSLRNIFKEITRDTKRNPTTSNCLISWAKQGVLLLNTSLTVVAGQANSHSSIGWQTFTDKIIESLNVHPEPLVFLLWGKNAAKKTQLITSSRHLVLTAPHPSPLSAHRGFAGCGHFSKANEWLKRHGKETINW